MLKEHTARGTGENLCQLFFRQEFILNLQNIKEIRHQGNKIINQQKAQKGPIKGQFLLFFW